MPRFPESVRFSGADILLLAVLAGPAWVGAQEPGPGLAGRVTSAEEGAMEGVLISARRAGSPISVTVVSDRSGRFSFPPGKLPPGKY
jgi:virginiamycin B lyase